MFGYLSLASSFRTAKLEDGNFLLLRPYHGEHGPKVPFTPEYIVLQRVLQKRECVSILTNNLNKHASYFKWLANQSYLNINIISYMHIFCCKTANIAGSIIEKASIGRREGLVLRARVFSTAQLLTLAALVR
jgi:hypothetical protein